jgi:hypothetical protein
VKSLGHVEIQLGRGFENPLAGFQSDLQGGATYSFDGTVIGNDVNGVEISPCFLVDADGGVQFPTTDENGDPIDCYATWHLDVVGPGLTVPVEYGMRVHVAVAVSEAFALGTSALITDLSTTPPTLLLAASGGIPVLEDPFEVQEV